jgi:predicted outer membrane repeat protein
MNHTLGLRGVCLLALSLAVAPSALASTTWYVDGVNGNDSNNCLSPTTACKTIGHAISLASSGDSVSAAAATYTENLAISKSLKIGGSSSATTIIDGGGVNTVVTISSVGAHVTLSQVTIRNGAAPNGGGISNNGTLTISDSIISRNTTKNNDSSAGGGIYNTGSLTINNSILFGNSAIGGRFCGSCSGGAIYNSGTVTITHSAFSANNALNGGGIYSQGILTVRNSMLSGNCCSALYNAGGTLTISNSTPKLRKRQASQARLAPSIAEFSHRGVESWQKYCVQVPLRLGS